MSRRPHYHRLDSLGNDERFVWTNGEMVESGTVLYQEDGRVYVRLDRGRGFACEEWDGNRLVQRVTE